MSGLESPLEVLSRPEDGAVVVSVAGDLVLTSMAALEGAVAAALDAGTPRVVVDLGRATHVDTPGFALLVKLAGRCGEAGGGLSVARLPESFREVAHGLRLAEAFDFFDTVDAALGGR